MQNELKKTIKFRAWDNLTKTMMSHEQVLKHFHGCYEIGLDPFQDEHLTYMRFTGYKDIAGNEIYEGDIFEGDIIEGEGLTFEVCSDFTIKSDNNTKIIGNIFEGK